MAAGAQRPKSRYGGTLEGLSYVRLWLFERENRDLLRMNSAELLESFFDMQKDYRMQVAAQYVAEVAERFLPEREQNERAFRLVLAVLRGMKHSGEVNRPLLYFNYWLLRLGGLLPELGTCAACGRMLGEEPAFYGEGSEGLLCADCRPAQAGVGIPSGARAVAQTYCQGSLDRWLASGKEPSGVREAQRFLEEVIESHLERKLVTRPLLADEI